MFLKIVLKRNKSLNNLLLIEKCLSNFTQIVFNVYKNHQSQVS